MVPDFTVPLGDVLGARVFLSVLEVDRQPGIASPPGVGLKPRRAAIR